MAGRQSPLPTGRDNSGAPEQSPRKKQEPLTTRQPNVAGLRPVVQRITFLARKTATSRRLRVRRTLAPGTTFLGPQPTLRRFNRTNVLLLPTRETRNWTRNTSNSRTR